MTRPGPYPVSGQMTVLQLISVAGGLTEYADGKRIMIMRTEVGKTDSFRFNYNDVSQGQESGAEHRAEAGRHGGGPMSSAPALATSRLLGCVLATALLVLVGAGQAAAQPPVEPRQRPFRRTLRRWAAGRSRSHAAGADADRLGVRHI